MKVALLYILPYMLVLLMAVGCTAPAPAIEEKSPPAAQEEVVATETPPPAEESPAYQVTSLTFSGQGDTFLEAIGRAQSESDGLLLQRYVEVGNELPALWQGEALHYAARTRLFLQRMQNGSGQAVQVEIAAADPDLGRADLLAALDAAQPAAPDQAGAPDVEILFVRAKLSGDNVWSFDVRLNHPDTGWEDYVDGWQVESATGEILGTRILLHPHDTEMPFSRSLSGVTIPADLETVYIRTHDLISGYSRDAWPLPLGEAAATDQYEIVR